MFNEGIFSVNLEVFVRFSVTVVVKAITLFWSGDPGTACPPFRSKTYLRAWTRTIFVCDFAWLTFLKTVVGKAITVVINPVTLFWSGHAGIASSKTNFRVAGLVAVAGPKLVATFAKPLHPCVLWPAGAGLAWWKAVAVFMTVQVDTTIGSSTLVILTARD